MRAGGLPPVTSLAFGPVDDRGEELASGAYLVVQQVRTAEGPALAQVRGAVLSR
ncbi:MAG: hypothetical protein AB1505_26170 [Candidatus Latescibacterota bacterium]